MQRDGENAIAAGARVKIQLGTVCDSVRINSRRTVCCQHRVCVREEQEQEQDAEADAVGHVQCGVRVCVWDRTGQGRVLCIYSGGSGEVREQHEAYASRVNTMRIRRVR